MAEVITWRQMAGPNFSGTAAAMDAAGDRLKQGTDLLGQFAADQTKLFQQEKAKLKADNTARALSELSGIKSLDELNAVTPKFTFDALRSQYGEDIDAGAVAQQAAAQKGIIEQDQLRSVDLANKTRTAQEAPIMGQYSESIQAALNKGDVAGAKKLYEESTSKLTDATPLSNLITDYEAAQFDKGLKQTEANQQQTLFNQAQQDRKTKLDYVANLAKQYEDVNLGKKKEITFIPPKGVPISEAYNDYVKTSAAAIEQMDLNPEAKNSLLMEKNYFTSLLTKAEENNNLALTKRREIKPVAHPQVTAFFNTLSPNEKAAVDSVTTPEGVITNYITKAGIEPKSWEDASDIGSDEVIDKIQEKLGDVKLSSIDSRVVAAAMQGVTKNSDNKLNGGTVDLIVQRIKEYNTKNTEYKQNKLEEDVVVNEKASDLKELSTLLNKLENVNLNEARVKRKNENALTFASLTGKEPVLKTVDETNGKESEKVGKIKSDIANIAERLGIYDERLKNYLQAGGQP